MKLVYEKIKEILREHNFTYDFDMENPSHQFKIYTGIDDFSDLFILLYISEDVFLFKMIIDKVKVTKGLYEVINEWNKESLTLKLYVGEENFLIVESCHCHSNKEDIGSLLNLCLDSFLEELQFFTKIKDYIIISAN